MGHGSFRGISMGNVNIKRPLLLESYGKVKDVKSRLDCRNERWEKLQIREAFWTESRRGTQDGICRHTERAFVNNVAFCQTQKTNQNNTKFHCSILCVKHLTYLETFRRNTADTRWHKWGGNWEGNLGKKERMHFPFSDILKTFTWKCPNEWNNNESKREMRKNDGRSCFWITGQKVYTWNAKHTARRLIWLRGISTTST